MADPQAPPDFVDLDQAFAGVDERTDGGVIAGSSEVENGARVRSATNMRFTGRAIETRCGYVWSNRYNPTGNQNVIDYDYTLGKNIGAGRYADANEQDFVLIAREFGGDSPHREVYLCRDNAAPVTLQAGILDYDFVTASRREDMVRFSQIGGDVIMWRRDGTLRPMLWDGDLAGQFTDIADVAAADETPEYYVPLPAEASFGITAGERLVFPCGSGELGYTDILDGRRWDSALSRLRPGNDGGEITGLALWRNSTLLVFKSRSIWAIDNWFGDLSTITLQLLTNQAGCVAHDTITEVGGDIIWLGQGGVYRLEQVLDTTRQLSPIPVSFLIPTTMNRINWSTADLASAALSRGQWVLAVPVDGATVPNSLIVWSSVTQEWQGEDIPGGSYNGTAWSAGEYLGIRTAMLFGQDTLAIVQKDWTLTQGWGHKDTGAGATDAGDIASSVRLRGYHAQDHEFNSWSQLRITTEELGTEGVTLSAYIDGRRTAIPVQGATTRDRTRWLTWGRAAIDISNADDDFATPDREDYSWYVEGQNQVETATVVGTINGNGNATVVVTSSGMTGSPITLAVPVLIMDSASGVATKIRVALNANAVIAARFTIGGTGAAITLTRSAQVANDATLNVSIDNGTCAGLTAAPTSVNTTAGILADGPMTNDTGIGLGLLQCHRLQGMVVGNARTISPEITTTAGRLRINVVSAKGVRP